MQIFPKTALKVSYVGFSELVVGMSDALYQYVRRIMVQVVWDSKEACDWYKHDKISQSRQ